MTVWSAKAETLNWASALVLWSRKIRLILDKNNFPKDVIYKFTVMRHFEDIWNEAEDLYETIVETGQMTGIDKSPVGLILSVDYDEEAASILVGQILWQLCVYCKDMQQKGKTINSASALQYVINTNKIRLLDPDDA